MMMYRINILNRVDD